MLKLVYGNPTVLGHHWYNLLRARDPVLLIIIKNGHTDILAMCNEAKT